MVTASTTEKLILQPHKDVRKMLRVLGRLKSTLPEFQLILQAPDCSEGEPITENTLKDIFIISSAAQLLEASEIIKSANETRKLRVLFVHSQTPEACVPQLFGLADLRLARNVMLLPETDLETPQRVMRAWAWDSHHELIATAGLADQDTLVVLSCAMKPYVVKFSDLTSFRDVSVSDRREFEIDPDGSFIHWTGSDIHLGIESFRYVSEPKFRQKLDAEKLAHDMKFGQAIGRLRREAGFTQANVPDVSERTMRDIENKGARPSMSTLEKLADAHSMSLNEYLEAVSETMVSL